MGNPSPTLRSPSLKGSHPLESPPERESNAVRRVLTHFFLLPVCLFFISLPGCAHLPDALNVERAVTSELFATGDQIESPRGEPCYNLGVVELCINVEDVESLLGPNKFRAAFVRTVVPEVRQYHLKEIRLVENSGLGRLGARWNAMVSAALTSPRGRAAYYEWILVDKASGIMSVSLPSPMFKISGLPKKPRMSLVVQGFGPIMGTAAWPKGSKDTTPEDLARLANEQLLNVGHEMGSIMGMPAIIAEYSYQIRQIVAGLDKEVFVFAHTTGLGASPYIDDVGNLYVPEQFLDLFDRTDQDLIMLHEAAHLARPSRLVVRVMARRGAALGVAGEMLAQMEEKGLLSSGGTDSDLEADAQVLALLRGHPTLRERYRSLIARLDKGAARGEFIGYLNSSIASGTWPRPAVKLPAPSMRTLVDAYGRYEYGVTTEEKARGMTDLLEQLLEALPATDRAFFRPLYPILVKHALERRDTMFSSVVKTYSISERLEIDPILVDLFEEVAKAWGGKDH